MSSPSKAEVLLAYRQLYTHALRAVQYSAPARYTLRDHLRLAFRRTSPAAYDRQKIDNTLEFLRGAAREKGLEHRIVKSLIHTWWHERLFKQSSRYTVDQKDRNEVKCLRTAYDPFNHTLHMLNESMGMCI
ncbi:uncharacterized protein K452DRAFT_224438 [Aplosporella prunicola CBS 121167]|uniref:DUF1763-domain-containing protein n=1 Tax=Aplosporella prunicola CBS 121167 TaxID=1176127 RepID=A0A6A6BKR4_9PEZI|nr:uncharacterized protein K452DRAFT_224438 [Aplosporella prunicola CBS 121167]KAF2143854.1 hypothetical protein K452DRAFT_224438 [Aplosporella prunicola CBS 121167]